MSEFYCKDRRDMARFLSERMSAGFKRYKDEKKLERSGGLLKTYLLEVHINGDREASHADISRFLRKIARGLNFDLKESQEESFFNITKRIKGVAESFYLDASDARFWFLHTVGLSQRTDSFIYQLIRYSPQIDTAWLPTQTLEHIARKGQFKGFGGTHDDSPFLKREEGQQEIETLSLKLWGSRAKDVLQTLKDSPYFKNSLAVSSIRVGYSIKSEESIVDNFTYNGKVTAMGSSFLSHINLVSDIFRKTYKEKIDKIIENELAIQFRRLDSRIALEGEPIFINFSRRFQNIGEFISAIFSSALPFRLWGLSEIREKDFARVYAVDLHVGNKLLFEIFEDSIRIFLPKGSCGNTLARFYTNFQQYYDSSATICCGKYEQIF